MARPTLLTIATRNAGMAEGLIDECARIHPELTQIFARTIKGRTFTSRVRTAIGNTSGSFRAANKGVTPHVHTYENRKFETVILNPRFECDKAVAHSSEDGPEAYIAEENQATLEGEFQAICRQLYYGTSTGGNSLGFPGLLGAVDSSMVVDATGTTASTGSSVWALRTGPLEVSWVWGENGKMEMEPVRIESLEDDAGGKFDGYVSSLLAFPGVAVRSKWSCARIKNLTADSGKGLTDALLSQVRAKFPAGMKPDLFLCTPRSLAQLQSSRTATSATGAPAPVPTDHMGIPIFETDAILNTEAIA